MNREFDLTKGSSYIDCNLHCPAHELGETKPHDLYAPNEDEDWIVKMEGPYCNDTNAPFTDEAKPRKFLRRITLIPRRICLYRAGLLSHTTEQT